MASGSMLRRLDLRFIAGIGSGRQLRARIWTLRDRCLSRGRHNASFFREEEGVVTPRSWGWPQVAAATRCAGGGQAQRAARRPSGVFSERIFCHNPMRRFVAMASLMRDLHVPLPEATHRRLRAEAERSLRPATEIAREAIDRWLLEARRTAIHEAIASYAVPMAGTADDLDPELETAGIEHLVRKQGGPK